MTDKTNQLIDQLKSGNTSERLIAANELAQLGDERAISALITAVSDPDSSVRVRAIQYLGGTNSSQVVDALITALNDTEKLVKVTSVEMLGRIGGQRALMALVESLKDNEGYVRVSAVHILRRTQNKQVVSALVGLLKNQNDDTRKSAIEALGYIASPLAVTALTDILSDENVSIRESAAEALKNIGGEHTITALVNALQRVGRERGLEETRAFIVHEVRSAIGPLRLIAKKLRACLQQPTLNREEVSEYAHQIIRHTDIAYDVLNQYVSYTRLLSPDFKYTNLNQFIKESLDEFNTTWQMYNIKIIEQWGQIPLTYIDPTLFAQALRNIFSNALEAMEREGTLTVTTSWEHNFAVITIKDTGVGIKEEHFSRLFELGFTTKLGKHGAGLGLELVRRIVEEGHQGRLSIENNIAGSGALVKIELPADA